MPVDQVIPTIEERFSHLLKQIGGPGRCRGCGLEITWVRHNNGKAVPYVPHGPHIGLNHFIDCPAAKDFKK